MNATQLFAIIYSMPSVKNYISSSKMIEPTLENKLASETKMWLTTFFKTSVLNTQSDNLYEKINRVVYEQSEWKNILESIFSTLKMPPKYSGKVYIALTDLDNILYNIIYPFQTILEKSPEEIARNIHIAATPLTTQQLENLRILNGITFSQILM